ncbi:copper amine oxidase N-terminal domain-containing protein [Paenibacillus sp. N1-5-1-14]|uniref:copper amine oxidase N-terminal domain-containing protein n=1 Tax=Paenibacillus radicibacter TaxID=2972488 RepID=UPI0021592B18|nr:copper amine oxidase N-terminal domain-containing protein [Paenibacillus radicibacter]MCR8641864.1 copper amine oxidase N-terminal domain-containing protein [Paenibacillus radicibacter]
MKARRLLALILFGTLVMGTVDVAAQTLWGTFEGYNKIKVNVNDKETDFNNSEAPALSMKGAVMMPLRPLADSLHALVKWDSENQTVDIYKPNVHISLVKDVTQSKTGEYTLKSPFGVVKKGEIIDFVAFAEVDNLKTKVSAIRVSILTPSGDNVKSFEDDVNSQGESFWYPMKLTNISFAEAGTYKLTLSMKLAGSNDFTVVSEKNIVSQ